MSEKCTVSVNPSSFRSDPHPRNLGVKTGIKFSGLFRVLQEIRLIVQFKTSTPLLPHSLNVGLMLLPYTFRILAHPFTRTSRNFPKTGTSSVNIMYTLCTLMFTLCTLYVHFMYTYVHYDVHLPQDFMQLFAIHLIHRPVVHSPCLAHPAHAE